MTERVDPPFIAPERDMLVNWLEFHRATLAMKCEGLDAAQLRTRAVPPSTMSLLGLVRHMAEVERNWFRRVWEGAEAPYHYCTEDDWDADFNAVDTADADEAFATWRAECEHAREAVAAADDLDALGKRQRHGHDVSMRWILVHMIEEYARHNGHADLLRECIDGTTGD